MACLKTTASSTSRWPMLCPLLPGRPPLGSSALVSCSRISRSQPCCHTHASTLPRDLSEILPTH
ncbi:hypothetical protein LZ32DRAFT_695309, partial [Colletotrichum eremochloae]